MTNESKTVKPISDCCFAPILDEEHGGPELCSKCRDHCGVYTEPETVRHTPGPWRAVPDGTGTGRWFTITGRQDYYDDGSPQEIARTDTYETRGGTNVWEPTELAREITADARLIAAAPDLLEAVRVAVAALEGVRWCPYCGHPSDWGVKPMPHTNTCYFPGLIVAFLQATGAQS